jgi:glycogen(starch) synthase
MRILHLTPEYPPVIWGGLGTAVGGLVSASARAGLSVGVLLVGGVLLVDEERGYGAWQPVSAERVSGERSIFGPEGVIFFHVSPSDAVEVGIRLVRRWKPDVIHLHTAWLWQVAREIQERTGIPLVFTVHSLDRAEYEVGHLPTQWQAQEEVIATAARVIALSQSEKELLAQYCPQARDRVRIVGNGIDDCVAARATAYGRDVRNESPLVLYTGRFVARKGIGDLLEAIPRVLERAPRTRFVLIGGYGAAEEISRDWLPGALYPHLDQVTFTGWLPPSQVARWYRAADILVVPSWYEPFGMVILEGMLYGLPIAASAVGGPAEILENGRTGLFFPPKDAGALADAILKLVATSSLRRRMGVAAADEVRRKWLWPAIVQKMRTIYREAALTRSPKPSSKALAAAGRYR